jgi:hypothetical protein
MSYLSESSYEHVVFGGGAMRAAIDAIEVHL